MSLIFETLRDDERRALAEAIVATQYNRFPDLAKRYGADGRAKCIQDVGYSLLYLEAALNGRSPELFHEYVAWLAEVLERYGVAVADVTASLEAMRDTLDGLNSPFGRAAAALVADVLVIPPQRTRTGDHAGTALPLGGLAQRYLEAQLRGDRRGATGMVMDAVAGGTSVAELYLDVFQPCLREVGRLWQTNRISVAQEHLFTAATQMVMSQLYPYIFDRPGNGLKMVAVCANGELHEIGVRMVADFFEMEGWDTTYLGASTPVPSVIRLLAGNPPDLLAVSATIAPNVAQVGRLIAAVRDEPALAGLPILVGGQPFNRAPELWRRLGADGWAADAAEALGVARALVTGGAR